MTTESVIGRAYRGYWTLNRRSGRFEYFAFLTYVVGVTTGLLALERWFHWMPTFGGVSLSSLFFFFNLLPLVAVFVRRLHDADEDIPLMLVPVWCLILLGVGLMANFGLATVFGLFFIPIGQLLCLEILKDPGTTGGNRFGPDLDTPEDVHWHEHLAWQQASSKEVYRVRHQEQP